MSEGVSFKYERVECDCVSFKYSSKVTFKVEVELVSIVGSGVCIVSECVVSCVLGVSVMHDCMCGSCMLMGESDVLKMTCVDVVFMW